MDGSSAFGSDLAPDLRHDVTVGAFSRIGLFQGFTFQPEIAWVRKGGRGNLHLLITGMGQTDVIDVKYQERVDWIEAPLLMRWELPVHGGGPYLILGPTPAWRVGEGKSHIDSWSWTTTGGPSPANVDAEIFEDVGTFDDPTLPSTSFDLGLAGGLGIRIGHGPVRFALEARYTRGLLDVHPSDAMDLKNEVFAVTTAIELR
jgi:hypothetical protein